MTRYMQRRKFLLLTSSAAALMLGGCSGGTTPDTTPVSVTDIIGIVQKNCGYRLDVQMVTAVIATVLAGFNAAAGAAATVAAGIAKQVEDMICAAVKAELAQLKSVGKDTASQMQLDVIVNGVKITGTYVP